MIETVLQLLHICLGLCILNLVHFDGIISNTCDVIRRMRTQREKNLYTQKLRDLFRSIERTQITAISRGGRPAYYFVKDCNTLHRLSLCFDNEGIPLLGNYIIEESYDILAQQVSREVEGNWERNNGACVSKTEPKEDRLDACPVCGSEVREIGRFYYCLNCEWDDLPQVGK